MPAAPGRPTLAFLLDNLYDSFQEGIWSSVAETAREQDVNLLCFLGGAIVGPEQPDAERRWGRNGVYELVHHENVDGILALSGSLGNFIDDAELARFFSRFPVPTVSLCRQLQGRPSLVVDGAAGVRELMAHLIEAHGRRRIAFIQGPPTNPEARERYAGYRAALADHQLAFDPACVVAGMFERTDGIRAVEELLDRRGVRPDAIVGANDHMALHAMAELVRRGIDVPGEIAVAGFDDAPAASTADPPFTTVRPPLEALGRHGVLRLLGLLRGEPVPEVETLPAQLLLRASCGCPPAARRLAPDVAGADRAGTSALEAALAAAERSTALRIRADEESRILARIALPTHLTELSYHHEALAVDLPTLGIRSFFLCGFLDDLGRRAELRFHYDVGDHLGLHLEAGGGPFRASSLLPGGFRPSVRHAHAVLPIYYLRERLGYIVCELGLVRPGLFETLGSQVSSVLKFTALVREMRHQANAFEEQVAARTQELREAQRLLLDTAHQAGMAEVAVGVLHNVGNLLTSVSICAEEIQAHLAVPQADGLEKLTALLTAHRDDLEAYFRTDPRAALIPDYLERLSSDLRDRLARSQDETRQLRERVGVLRDTIRGLQDLARRDHQAVVRESIELAEVLGAALDIQRPALLRHVVQVRLDLEEPLPRVVTERSKLLHVLVNLVKNAVEAMREAPESARLLTLTAAQIDDHVQLAIADTGVGVAAEDLPRIFSYGFTTKADGHGFGLHSCALHVRQLGGELTVQSEGRGRGATFVVTLPLRPDA